MSNPWQQTITIAADLARALIERQFPELSVHSFAYLGEGWDNKVYRVNDNLVFRFPRREDCAVDCMQNEIGAMPSIARLLPVPVSYPVYIGEATNDYPYPFAGFDYLPGQAINEVGLDILPTTDFPEKFAEFLKALHGIPLDDIPCQIPHEPRKMDFERCSKMILEAVQMLVAAELKAEASIKKTEKRLRELQTAFPVQDKYCMVHGDINSRHILLHDKHFSGVIDWGDLHPNTPAVDLSALYLLLAPEHHQRFWVVYGEVSEAMQLQAQLRALYLCTLLCRYALDIKDQKLLQICLQGLRWLLHG